MEQSHVGSCLCGQVRYKVEGQMESFYLCHCKHCQKDSGSAHAANLFSATAKLVWIDGEAHVKDFNLPQTRHSKSFCKECGSALPSLQMGGKLLVVPAGSLDSDMSMRPDAHLFNSSRALWDNNLQDVKKFERLPE